MRCLWGLGQRRAARAAAAAFAALAPVATTTAERSELAEIIVEVAKENSLATNTITICVCSAHSRPLFAFRLAAGAERSGAAAAVVVLVETVLGRRGDPNGHTAHITSKEPRGHKQREKQGRKTKKTRVSIGMREKTGQKENQ